MNINKEYKDIKMRATREVSEKKQERMKRKLLAATALMNYTKARDLHEDRDDLHEDREDLHEDREDLHEDRENLHEDRENLTDVYLPDLEDQEDSPPAVDLPDLS